MDKMLIQQESALDFSKMMHRVMTDYKKVIVVLSEGYKIKAEGFSGGVGSEYLLLIKDIEHNPTKYILVTFDGVRNEIFPLGLSGREIIDLSKKENEAALFRKLLDKPSYEFAEIGAVKPILEVKRPKDLFSLDETGEPIRIKKLLVRPTTSMSAAGVYGFAVNEFSVELENVVTTSIADYLIEIRIPVSMRSNRRLNMAESGFVSNGQFLIKNIAVSQKLFPGQSVVSDKFEIEVSASNYNQAREAEITIIVHSDLGKSAKDFKLADHFVINGDYGQKNDIRTTPFG